MEGIKATNDHKRSINMNDSELKKSLSVKTSSLADLSEARAGVREDEKYLAYLGKAQK